jgi:hypothetical protein
MRVDQNLVADVLDLKREYLCNSADALRAIKENEEIESIADSLHKMGLPALTKAQIGLLVTQFQRLIGQVVKESLYGESTVDEPIVSIEVTIAELTKPTAHKRRRKSEVPTAGLETPEILPNYKLLASLYSLHLMASGQESNPERAAFKEFCESSDAFTIPDQEGGFSLKELVSHLKRLNNPQIQRERLGYEAILLVSGSERTEEWLRNTPESEKHAEIVSEKLEECSSGEYDFNIHARKEDISQHPEFRHLQNWKDIYATAVNEMTLGVLQVERTIALAYVVGIASPEDSFTSEASVIAAIGRAHTKAVNQIKRVSAHIDKLIGDSLPDFMIENSKKSLARGRYLAKIVQENKKWLRDVLSR